MRRRDGSPGRAPDAPDPLAWAAPGATVAYVDEKAPDVVEHRTVQRVTGSLVVTTDGERWRRRALQASGPWAGSLTVLAGTRAKHLSALDHPALPGHPPAASPHAAAAPDAGTGADTRPGTGPGTGLDGSATRVRHVTWSAAHDVVRTATVRLGPDRLTAHGATRTASYALSWTLTTGPGWVARRLDVTARGLDDGRPWSRELTLERDPGGTWSADARATGALDAPPPGPADSSTLASLAGALDVSLGSGPFDVTVPARRLRAAQGPIAEARLPTAHVEVPSLRVSAGEQVLGDGPTPGTVRHRPPAGSAVTLTLDDDGLVVPQTTGPA